MPEYRRLAVLSGSLAAVATPLAILAATAFAPWFTWRANALSDLGVAPGTALVFNGALLVGGKLALPYAWAVWDATAGLRRLPTVGVAGAAVSMAGVGAFPSGHPLHFPFALGFYLLVTATLAADGILRYRRRSDRVYVTDGRAGGRGGRLRESPDQTGLASLGLAAGHLLAWALWLAGVRPGPGLAIPEFVGALVFAAWVLAFSPVAPLGAVTSGAPRSD